MEYKVNLDKEDVLMPVIELGDGLRVIKEGYKLDDSYYHGKPARVKFNINAANAEDFVNLVKEYKQENTKVFYNDNSISAVINFPGKKIPEHRDQFINLGLRHTSEYGKFLNFTNRKLSQEEYIHFLNEMEPFISNIDTITLMETAENLRLASDVDSKIEYDKNSRSYSFEIKSGKKGGKLPDRLKISIPMYIPTMSVITEFDVFCRYHWSERDGFGVTLLCYGRERTERVATDEIVRTIVSHLDTATYRIS